MTCDGHVFERRRVGRALNEQQNVNAWWIYKKTFCIFWNNIPPLIKNYFEYFSNWYRTGLLINRLLLFLQNLIKVTFLTFPCRVMAICSTESSWCFVNRNIMLKMCTCFNLFFPGKWDHSKFLFREGFSSELLNTKTIYLKNIITWYRHENIEFFV